MSSFQVLDAAAVDYETFRELCLKPNRPALIRNAGVHFRIVSPLPPQACDQADCLDDTPFKRMLSRKGLASIFGDLEKKDCPVYRRKQAGTVEAADDESDGPMVAGTASLSSILQSWGGAAGPLNTTAEPQEHPRQVYLMNWHFQQEVEAGLQPLPPALYAVPSFLGLDLMHAYHLHCQENLPTVSGPSAERSAVCDTVLPLGNGTLDYRFVYMGEEGTWTPFHHDVFGSFSWSLNVSGKKLWYFFDAASQAAMQMALPVGRPLPYDMRVLSGLVLEAVVQEPGDLMFVPSRWYHQVHNVEGAPYPCSGHQEGSADVASADDVAFVIASINHNWMSFEQLPRMVGLLCSEVDALLRMTGSDTRLAFDDEEWVAMVDRMLWGSGSWNVAIMDSFLRFCETLLHDPNSWLPGVVHSVATGAPKNDLGRCQVEAQRRLCCIGGPLFVRNDNNNNTADRIMTEWVDNVAESRRLLEQCKMTVLAKPI